MEPHCEVIVARWQVMVARWQVMGAKCQVMVAKCQVMVARCQVMVVRCQVMVARCKVILARCHGHPLGGLKHPGMNIWYRVIFLTGHPKFFRVLETVFFSVAL